MTCTNDVWCGNDVVPIAAIEIILYDDKTSLKPNFSFLKIACYSIDVAEVLWPYTMISLAEIGNT